MHYRSIEHISATMIGIYQPATFDDIQRAFFESICMIPDASIQCVCVIIYNQILSKVDSILLYQQLCADNHLHIKFIVLRSNK